MKKIYKYDIEIKDKFSIRMPAGAKILAIQCQYLLPKMWAIVDDQQPEEERNFLVFGTGHDVDNVESLNYIDTIQLAGGGLVFHIFEALE